MVGICGSDSMGKPASFWKGRMQSWLVHSLFGVCTLHTWIFRPSSDNALNRLVSTSWHNYIHDTGHQFLTRDMRPWSYSEIWNYLILNWTVSHPIWLERSARLFSGRDSSWHFSFLGRPKFSLRRSVSWWITKDLIGTYRAYQSISSPYFFLILLSHPLGLEPIKIPLNLPYSSSCPKSARL